MQPCFFSMQTPYTIEITGAMYEKVHPSEPVNKGYPINPFLLPKNFMYNGKLKKTAGSGSSLEASTEWVSYGCIIWVALCHVRL